MGFMKFLPKPINVYFREKERFDCMNNHAYSKSANFGLNNGSKINFRILVVLSYIS